MNILEKTRAIHADHHHAKYDWRDVFAWMDISEPVTHRPGWDDAKQQKLDTARDLAAKILKGKP